MRSSRNSRRYKPVEIALTQGSPADCLHECNFGENRVVATFYFDTALSSSAAALPTLLAFAKPGHITFGSDFPFAPLAAGQLFAAGLQNYPGFDDTGRRAIERDDALALSHRLAAR